MPLNEPKYHEILLRLADARVEAIVVGMAAAVIQGAPTMTWNLDIVHHRTKENVERLLSVLEDIDAVARGDNHRIRPNASHLIGPGHILLETRFGDFDCLGAIDGSRSVAVSKPPLGSPAAPVNSRRVGRPGSDPYPLGWRARRGLLLTYPCQAR